VNSSIAGTLFVDRAFIGGWDGIHRTKMVARFYRISWPCPLRFIGGTFGTVFVIRTVAAGNGGVAGLAMARSIMPEPNREKEFRQQIPQTT